jgi:hypothetical protein
MKRGLILMLMSLAVPMSAAFAVPGTLVALAGHQNWGSAIVRFPTGEMVFRAVTTQTYADGSAVLALDRSAEDCRAITMSITVAILNATLNAHEGIEGPFSGQLRVDMRPVHAIKFIAGVEAGDNDFHLTVSDINRHETLYADLESGNTVRFKLEPAPDAGRALYLRFSLAGSRAAMDRSLHLCLQYAVQSTPRDEDYFHSGPGQSADEEFF